MNKASQKLGKKLGQNFLNSKRIAQIIVEESGVKKDDLVIEIGPGKGILTNALLIKGAKVLAIEKDRRFEDMMNKRFKGMDFEIQIQDIRKFRFPKDSFYVVSNIPYYLSGWIIKKLLTLKRKPDGITLMVQREVADRMIDKKESILSLSVKFYADVKKVKNVSRKMFSPQPMVDSAIVKFSNIRERDEWDERKFFDLVKLAFSHKRKQFLGNVKGSKDYKKIKDVLDREGIRYDARSEDISIDIFEKIIDAI